ncbi:calponin homology domain-containing protein DDB_G0272472-like [Impatiens glandulifera]|uniref:calponin homology domain-containing protein DDB_G0272472-like n=1 Tax=Impatiens glandulifera TaxID=253017 RepID=UPI001FB0B32E|nr:calponin homology domain-containing protein DDB_G0272472-like [Impatiens glandulifera]
MAIVRGDKIYWGTVIFEQFCEMIVKKDGQVQAFAMQIVKILKFLNVELGEGEPLPLANILNSEKMSKKTAKVAKPKSSRTKSSKGTSSLASAEESSKQEDAKGKAVQAEASQKKKGRKKQSAKKSSNKPADYEKTLSSDHSPKRTADVLQPIPINTVHPIHVDSPSPRQAEPSGSQETKSNSKEAEEVSIHSENHKSPNKNIDEIMVDVADQVEIPGQSETHQVEETTTTENIIPPAQEGNIEEKEPSGSAGNKSVPIETTLQQAQDGPAASTITPEGQTQVNKGKEVLHEVSTVKGQSVMQTGPQPVSVTEAEVPISTVEEKEMFEQLLLDMNKDAEEMVSSYHLWVQLRCETKLSDMIPDMSGNKHWEKLLELEEEALKLAGTNVIQAAFSKTLAIHENAQLHAVKDALREAEGATLTPIESRMFERFHSVRGKLSLSVDRLEAKWRNDCKHYLTHADLYQSKPFFATGESSITAENRRSDPPQTDKAPELEQVKEAVVGTLISCLGKYSIATDEKIAVVETKLTKTIRTSIQSETANTTQTSIKSMINETVQTSIKSMIAESVQTATAPLIDMLQAMAAQIEELSKLQVNKTQAQISSDAETAKKLQDEEKERERLRKEIEEKDHELAKQCNEEEQAALQEPTPAQPSHSMKTRNKNKRKAVAEVMKLEERNSRREIQPVRLNEEPLDEEEEKDLEILNRRKKKPVEISTATPSIRPIVAQTPRLPRLYDEVITGSGISSQWRKRVSNEKNVLKWAKTSEVSEALKRKDLIKACLRGKALFPILEARKENFNPIEKGAEVEAKILKRLDEIMADYLSVVTRYVDGANCSGVSYFRIFSDEDEPMDVSIDHADTDEQATTLLIELGNLSVEERRLLAQPVVEQDKEPIQENPSLEEEVEEITHEPKQDREENVDQYPVQALVTQVEEILEELV